MIVTADAEKHHMESLWRIFVEPVYQDRGIGQEAFRQPYRPHPNARRWTLGTPESHVKNRHLYERTGFTLLTERKPEHVWFRSADHEDVLPREDRLKL